MIPKIDLHTHLDGAVKVSTMRELYTSKTGKDLPNNALLQIASGQPTLTEYLEYFNIPIYLMKENRENIERIAYEMVEQLYSQSITYAEVRYAPQLFLNTLDKKGCYEIINAVNKGFAKGMEEFSGITVSSIICLMRGLPFENNVLAYETAKKFSREQVVAIDLAGDEGNFSGMELKDIFLDAKKNDFHITMHAGESNGPESIKMALDFGAERIGHGLSAWQDEMLLSLMKERQICVETCPISNFQTGAINRYGYKIKTFLDKGIPVAVNTDNLTVSNTNLKKECDYLKENFLFTESDFKKMEEYAFKHSFIKKN